MSFTSRSDLPAAINRSLHQHWRMFLLEGIVLLVLGIAAIVLPPLAGLGVTIVVGWLLLIGGVVGLVATFGARHAPGFVWSVLSAVVALVTGLLLLLNPLAGLVSLTYVLIAYFIIDGVLSIVFAFEHRREQPGRWEWLAFSGVADLVIAAIIVSAAPASFAWALGLLVGIDLIFAAVPMIGMALHARRSVT